MLVEWVPGDHVTLERNPDYWNAGSGEPFLDRITFRLVLDTETRINSVRGGEVNLAQSTNGAEVLNADDSGMVGFPVEGPGITIQMNNTRPPFDDPRVRMAVLQATDREALLDVVFEGAGTYPPNNFIIANDSEYAAEGIEYPEYDPDAAAELVQEYEAENGPISVTYNCHNQPDLVNMAQVLQQMWTEAGMDIEVQIKDQQTLVSDIFDQNYEITCFGAVGQEDPDLAYYGSLHSASPTNSVGYNNPEVDAALDTGRRSADPEERRAAYTVVQEALASDVPLFQAVTSPWGWFGSEDVGGMFTRRNGTFNTAPLYLSE
jgi:peptide/nickel transport system substrate-binding protein